MIHSMQKFNAYHITSLNRVFRWLHLVESSSHTNRILSYYVFIYLYYFSLLLAQVYTLFVDGEQQRWERILDGIVTLSVVCEQASPKYVYHITTVDSDLQGLLDAYITVPGTDLHLLCIYVFVRVGRAQGRNQTSKMWEWGGGAQKWGAQSWGPGGYSDLSWTGVCHSSLKTPTHL